MQQRVKVISEAEKNEREETSPFIPREYRKCRELPSRQGTRPQRQESEIEIA